MRCTTVQIYGCENPAKTGPSIMYSWRIRWGDTVVANGRWFARKWMAMRAFTNLRGKLNAGQFTLQDLTDDGRKKRWSHG